MSRAAAFTFAASLAVTSGALGSACGGVVEGGNHDPGGGQTMYGLAQIDDGGSADYDGGGTAAMYGLAQIEDSGSPSDDGGILPMYGAANPDASLPDDDGGFAAPYGLPGPPPNH